MIGLFYPGICRLDYDPNYEGGVFPRHIESCNDPAIARWLENIIHILPIEPRPLDYSPLGTKNLDPVWATKLSESGRDCYQAILDKNIEALGASMNLCMAAWEALLPGTVRHPTVKVDLCALLAYYQRTIPRRDVLWLRWRISVCGIRKTGARGDQSEDSHCGGEIMATVKISGSFDDLRSPHIRFLEEASERGEVGVQLWSDRLFRSIEGREPKFPEAERLYFLDAIRYVHHVEVVPELADCNAIKLDISDPTLKRFPKSPAVDAPSGGRKKVLVTGCYDWLHTGHVRFFEEVSEYGDVYAVVGHDANIELLKGKGHPHFPEDERRFVVGSLKYVKQALVSTGHGWMDAAPEIAKIKPDIYAVNEDGDKPERNANSAGTTASAIWC